MKKNIAAIIVSVFGIIGGAVAAPLYIGDGVSTIGVSGTNEWTGSANWSSDAVTPTWQAWADSSDAIIKNTGAANVAVKLSSPVTVQNLAWDTSAQGLTILGTNMPTLTINGLVYTAQTTSRQVSFNAVNLAGNMAVSNLSRFVLGSGTTISPGTTITNTDKTNIRLSSGSNDMSGLTVRLARGDGSLDCTSNATVGTVTGFGFFGSASATNRLTINNLSIDNSGAIATMTSLVPVTLGSGTHTFLVKSLSGTNTASKLAGAKNVLGGTLAVQIAAGSDALKSGDVFTLFTGTNSAGFSSTNLPSLAPSLSWGTDKLVSRGLLYVTDGTFTPPDPQPPVWVGLPVFSDDFNNVTYNGTAVTNTRGWVVTGTPYWSTSDGVSNSGCFFLRNSTATMTRYTNITSAVTNSRDFRLKFDAWFASALTNTQAGCVSITTDSGTTWTTNFTLLDSSSTNVDYDLPGYTGSYIINIDTSGWTDGQLAGFGFKFWQKATLNTDHFFVDNVLLAVQTNATTTYALTVSNGSGSGSYTNGRQVAIAANVTSGIFVEWIGDTSYVADPYAANTTVTMPAQAVNLTATYIFTYALTVNSGSGSGSYTNGQQVAISAKTPLAKTFDRWTGSGTQYVASVTSPTTTVTIPAQNIILTATYNDLTTVTNFYANFTGSENGGAATSTNLNAGTAVGSWTVQNQLTSYTTNNPTRGDVLKFQAGQYTNNAVLATTAALTGGVNVSYDVRRAILAQVNTVSVKNENGDTFLEIAMSGTANGQFRISYNGVTNGWNDLCSNTTYSADLSDGIMDSVQVVLCETSFDAYFNNVQVVAGGAYNSSAARRLGKSVASLEFTGNGAASEIWYDNIRVSSIQTYALTVTSGSGSGSYTNGHQVAIAADVIGGKTFVA
ncbi:MAG: hypothetical protein WCH86_06325, partial [Kiritimatiellales bacterium]